LNPQRHYWSAVLAVVWKDLAIEWRSREMVPAMTMFGILVIIIFNFAFELDLNLAGTLSAGILWVTLFFAGILGLNRSMAAEKDRGSWDGLMLAPVDRSAIFLGKTLANLLAILAMAFILLPIFAVLFGVNVFVPGFLLVVFLGVLGYAAAGTLLAGMTVQTSLREALLPVLLLPVSIPLALAALRASAAYLVGGETEPWIALLLVFDAVFLALGWMFFDSIVEE
jgi:heme exporter protein B